MKRQEKQDYLAELLRLEEESGGSFAKQSKPPSHKPPTTKTD